MFRAGFHAHITTSLLVLMAGLLQVLPGLRRRLGKCCIVGIQILTRFKINDCTAHRNPCYACVGWSTYWQSNEWRAEKQVAKR